MAASSSAAAADSRPPKYDVFISFRGEDTRKGFTSHLYSALSGKQIEAYIDEVSLEKGDTISRALPEAIKESEISIIIFSENYGESRWCLDELVHILKCREEKDQIVLPIFYNIDPSHIRNQKETYAAFFVKHEERFEMEKVQKWRQSLKDAAAISGWDSRNMSESKIVQEVVERVRRELDTINSKRSDDFKGLVGIPKRLEKIKSFLDSQAVRVVGIWGMGGIGKTTLAKLVFKRFYNDFEGSYFAPSVREKVTKKGLDTLEREVFSELLGEKDLDILKSDVNDRLSRKRILLILDDVDDFEQLERLAGNRPFGPGSKIILTSRDLQVLNQLIDVTYEVQALDLNEASQLFYLKAFEENSCRTGYEMISAKVVSSTGGNPLALQVLGSCLKSLTIKDCVSALEKLKRIPHVNIQKVLRISYDGLDTEEQDAFLDIACLLKNEKRDFVESILEHKSSIVITELVHKSLINIDQYGFIRMHDLLQEMGREIVRQSTKKLGKRSRLWIAKDVYDVLENNIGTEAIEGIYLLWRWEHDVHLRPDVFKKMRKLRLLKFYFANPDVIGKVKVAIDGDLKSLPNSLRYLHWEHYPVKSLPSNFKPRNLVELHMPCSKLEQLWDGVQELGSLKHINLQFCRLLTKIPDLSRAPKLESIDLSCCESLSHIPSLNLNLQATVDESAYRHQWFHYSYHPVRANKTPGCIILYGCSGLTTLPEVSGNIRKLVLGWTALIELPASIESLENLLQLDLRYCRDLKRLPKLPRNIEVLLLDSSGIEQIPSSIEGLQKLSLMNCRSLLSLQFCTNWKALKTLNIIGLPIQELPSSIGMLYNVENLYIAGCKNLQSLPASIGMLYNLDSLGIWKCENLQSLPELPLFIEYVVVEDCSSLETVSSLRSTHSLGRWLDKYDCDRMRYRHRLRYRDLDRIQSQREFSFSGCENLGEGAINYRFREFSFSGCENLGEGAINNRFREFSFSGCENLGEGAINNIFREFLYKVFCTATTPPEFVHSEVCDHTKSGLFFFQKHLGIFSQL
ncbi:hypothetical protein UlMin_041892 [Ulmus minor]